MMKTISVTCILATPIVTSAGDVGDYILVSDSAQYLHIIENGEVLSSVYINSVVTTVSRYLRMNIGISFFLGMHCQLFR